MTTKKTTGVLAAALVAGGILIGGATGLSATHARYLADYGSNVTAENSEEQAESKGVRHMGDHEDAPKYFERMNGVDEQQ